MSNNKAVEELIESIKSINGKTVNIRVIMATIESLGIREIDVPNDYGFKSIEDLATHINTIIEAPKYKNLKNTNQLKTEEEDQVILENAYTVVRAKNFLKDYGTGLFHLIPIGFQLFTIVLFGLSLWTYSQFNDLQSTAVALGVILGFTVTGGFLQAIGKQVSFYWYNQDYKMTKASIINFLTSGVKYLVLTFVAIFVINSFLHIFPYSFVLIAFIYELLIGILLLALAPLATIKKRWVVSICIAVGTCVALFLHFNTNIYIYYIHWIGMLVTTALALGYLKYFLDYTLKYKSGLKNAYPKATLSIYRNFSYFFYGILIFVFIFTDRILAWSSTLNRNIPYAIYYEKNYEIGMDLAIIVFFLLNGVLEYSISSFNRTMEYTIRTTHYNQKVNFNTAIIKSYKRHCLLFAITALFIFGLLYLIVTQPWGYEAAFKTPIAPVSLKVLIMGAIGYTLLTFGMFNVLYMYTLNKHKKSLNNIIIACLVNIVIGLLFSRIIAYEYSALGLCFGALAFMILTTVDTVKFFKNLDYHYYASY